MSEKNKSKLPPLAVRGDEAAKLLSVSKKTLRKWEDSSENPPPYIKIGSCKMYSVAELQAWLSDQAGKVRSKPNVRKESPDNENG
ncbi:MAG: helix-turn-helix domain-containing protein [Pirellulaceae bacterium]